MMDPIEARFGALFAALAPAARRALATAIAKQLRQSQMRRIAAQKNPDGSDFEPRKLQLRHKKKKLRAGMFRKLRTSRFLKADGSADSAVVSFTRDVERIARVHQFGLRDKVSRKSAVEVEYPVRQLLGISAEDEMSLTRLITDHLAHSL